MAKYIIEHSIEYLGNGCSCCDPTSFDCYQMKDAETGQYFGYDDECYGFIVQQYAYKEEALEAILEKLGVVVECVYEGDGE